MEDKIELKKSVRSMQEKYIYYLIALSVASIGFSVQKTTDTALSESQIPLAIAVLCWGVSVFYGLKFLRTAISAIGGSAMYQETDNLHEKAYIRNEVEDQARKTQSYFRFQTATFFLGVVLFLSWHVIEMYLRGGEFSN